MYIGILQRTEANSSYVVQILAGDVLFVQGSQGLAHGMYSTQTQWKESTKIDFSESHLRRHLVQGFLGRIGWLQYCTMRLLVDSHALFFFTVEYFQLLKVKA